MADECVAWAACTAARTTRAVTAFPFFLVHGSLWSVIRASLPKRRLPWLMRCIVQIQRVTEVSVVRIGEIVRIVGIDNLLFSESVPVSARTDLLWTGAPEHLKLAPADCLLEYIGIGLVGIAVGVEIDREAVEVVEVVDVDHAVVVDVPVHQFARQWR